MRYGVEDMQTVTVDEQYTLKIETDAPWRSFRNAPTSKHWWLLDNGKPVAFLNTLTYDNDDNLQCTFVICDIEVRDGYRGEGLAKKIIRAAENVEGKTIWTSGNFTPLGAKALSWVPVYPWERNPGVKYDDMPFVRDWDDLHPINLL